MSIREGRMSKKSMSQQEIIQNLLDIRKQVLSILNLDFIINYNEIDDSESGYLDEEIALGIRGINYKKEKAKIDEFIRRRNEVLDNYKVRVDRAQDKYARTKKRTAETKPGKPPSKLLLIRKDPVAVAKYNEKVEKFNSQLDMYNQLKEEERKTGENYKNMCYEYENQRADFEEKLSLRNETLEKVLADDIIICLDNLYKLANKNIEQRKNFIGGFFFIFLAIKVYDSFSGRVTTVELRVLADQILEKLDYQLDNIIKNHKGEMGKSLLYSIDYFYRCYNENEKLFEAIENELRSIRDIEDIKEQKEIKEFISIPLNVRLEYHHVVDPDELQHIEQAVIRKRNKFQEIVNKIQDCSKKMEPSFEKIAKVKKKCNQYLRKMKENRSCKLDKLFYDIPFILRIFDECEQDEVMENHKEWIKEIQTQIENQYNFNLNNFIANAVDTELLYKRTDEVLNGNDAIRFLSQRNALLEKKDEIIHVLPQLDYILNDIKKLPQRKSAEAGKKISWVLFLSFFPIISIGTISPIFNLIRKFLPALSSNNSFYISLKESLINKFQFFLYTHALLALLFGTLTFFAGNFLRICAFLMTLNHISYSIVLAFQLSKIVKITNKELKPIKDNIEWIRKVEVEE